jgi:iron-sulfur cluster repair protein YtfE (RIC family)
MVKQLKFTDVGSYEEFAAMEIDRLRQLEFGPGGIMEMKQTIADKEAEIAKLEAELLEWKARAISLFHMVPSDVTVGEVKNARDAILKELGNK